MSRVVRLLVVLVGATALVTAATVVRVPALDLARVAVHVGSSRASADGAGVVAARRAAVERADPVCPGPETIGVRGVEPVGTAPAPATVDAASPPAGRDGGAAGGKAELRAVSLPGRLMTTRVTGSADARLGSVSTTAAAGLGLAATGATSPGLVAAQTTLVPAGDLRGLASTACVEPTDDAWLVAGGTDAGRRGRIVLVNPSANPVDVEVAVLGERGQVPRSPGSSVGVPGRSRTVLLLDALAPGVASPVVHVTTSGGAIAATLNDAWLSGTTPQGVDDAGPAAAPSRRVLVPALLGDGPSSVRVASTGAAEAVVQVRLLGPRGPVDVPGGGVLRVPGESSRSLDLGRLAAGGYTIEVTSDVPVVAGALLRRTGAAGELAWFGSAAPESGLVGAAGLRGGAGWSTSLVLGAPSEEVLGDLVTVRPDGSTASRPVDVPAGTTATVGTGDAVAAWVRPRGGSGGLVAARATTRQDAAGPLVTGGALRPAPEQQDLPALVPER